MKRSIIAIDKQLCNGCALCVSACHEGAIQMVNGKARLVSESYCDGLGACLPACPTGAIRIEERESAPFDEAAVIIHQAALLKEVRETASGCPGTLARVLPMKETTPAASLQPIFEGEALESQLRQWPIQIKLVSVNAPFFHNANVLIAATCSAFAYAAMHPDFIKGRITLIGCPKLDGVDYAEKLAAIFSLNPIQSVMVVRMQVPCCGGLSSSVMRAIDASNNPIPLEVITLSTQGEIISG